MYLNLNEHIHLFDTTFLKSESVQTGNHSRTTAGVEVNVSRESQSLVLSSALMMFQELQQFLE